MNVTAPAEIRRESGGGASERTRLPWRALLIGCLLLPVNAFWLVRVEMGWTPIGLYPFAIGLAFLLPTDMLFSAWFFCLMWRGERIAASQFGLSDYTPGFPYGNEQAFGAYMGVALIALWGLKPHLRALWTACREEPGEAAAPLSLRGAVWGAGIGIAGLVGFFWATGLPLWGCILGFTIYTLIVVACTRMRAELGPPAHDLHNGGPDYILTAIFGSRAFTTPELSVLTFFFWFNRAYRTIIMPYQLEAFQIGERETIAPRHIGFTLGLATVVGLLSGAAALYITGYRRRAETGMASHFTFFGWEAFHRLENWIHLPRPTDVPAALGLGVGLLSCLALHMMRMRFLGWPFHPLGLAVSASFSLSTLWVALLVTWLAKTITLRYGGLRGYRAALPFFLGLMMGDFIVGMLWPLAGDALGVNTYSFYF